MTPDEAYPDHPGLARVRHLQRAGRWNDALDLLSGADDPAAVELRADVLTDRHQWRVDDRTEALAAIDAVRPGNEPLATLLTAQIEYWLRLFERRAPDDLAAERRDLPTLTEDPVEDFLLAAKAFGDAPMHDWAMFWYAVGSENVRDDVATARPVYDEVVARATERGELLLASYGNRHLGFVAVYLDGDREAGLDLLRLSAQQRAAVAARPHVAAAQSALAMALDDIAAADPGAKPEPTAGAPGTAGPESTYLRALVNHTAAALDLTWLKTP
jgi:hypothetical protein